MNPFVNKNKYESTYTIYYLVLVNYHCWAIIKNRNRPLVVFRVALYSGFITMVFKKSKNQF
jgi:hypothetical protein